MLHALLAAVAWAAQAPIAEAGTRRSSIQVCQAAASVKVEQHLAVPRVWITDIQNPALTSPNELRGRRLSVRDLVVDSIDAHGFWILVGRPQCRMFVVPAEGSLIRVAPGEVVDLQGEFRHATQADLHDTSTPVFIYAYVVRKAPEGP